MKVKHLTGPLMAALATTMLAWTAPDFAAADEFALATNKAGRQRMLSQRIVKAYTQVGLKVQEDDAAGQLQVVVDVFEDQLAYLKEISPSREIDAGLRKVERLWKPFKAIALAPPTREGAKTLMEKDGELLTAANDVVKLFVRHSGSASAERVDICGRQRMLSQRIAKFYMLKSWKFTDPGIDAGIEQAASDFEKALKRLRADKGNTPAINTRLDLAAKEWKAVRGALKGSPLQPLTMATSSEKLLELMDEATNMYAALSTK